jgi:uncharacterized membrane protein
MTLGMYILIFYTYSFLGWCFESFGSIFNPRVKKFVNRGFLIGPICPVYGSGVVLITFLLRKYVDDIPALFFLSMLISGVLEYMTSYFMEKFFNARWWDYHNRKFNINGRVCLEMLIPFGIAGTVIAHFLNPMLVNFFSKIDPRILTVAIAIMVILNAVDYVISFVVISKFKKAVYTEADNTEEISNMVKEVTKEKLEEEKQNAIKARRKIRLKRLIIRNRIRYNSKKALSNFKISSKDIAKSIYDKYNEWNIKYLERRVSFDNKIVKLRESFRLSQEQFAENVKNRFNNDSYLRRRLIESFPNLTIKMPKMKGRKKN